ncbi:MAG TPA: sensor histidine kinase [Deltaproteobacteria bacterium]|nr:sensor histidine kinase [Deltaproteobacteria bacterium]
MVAEGGRKPTEAKSWKVIVHRTISTNSFHLNLNYSLFSPFRSLPPRVVIATPLNLFSKKYSVLVGYGIMETEWRSIIHAIGLISFYILVNAIVLLGFGLYIFHRRVIGPINKMVESVGTIREGDRLPLFEETRDNELGRLSRAINIMLQRLEENKKELKETIKSLEEANRNLNKVQKELIHSEKMASVGRLASGVAHEIGNPLGIILGYLEILKTGAADESEKDDLLRRMEDELLRIRGIITRLLDFARPGKGEKVVTNLHELISEICSLVSHQCSKKNIDLVTELQAGDFLIYSDPNQLKQVFLNLLFNSIDSIENGGRIKVRTYHEEGTEKGRDGNRVVVEIKDTGHGISKENLDKIFDPFFTTKDPGKGTGLGLSVSASILKSMNADIRVDSEKGKGTVIRVVFDSNSAK